MNSRPVSKSFAETPRRDRSLEGLSLEQQERLADVLDDCVRRWEQGENIDRNAVRTCHPDLAEHLDEYLDGLNYLHGAAEGFRPELPFAESLTNDSQIGDFQILREIGRGGMGVVYEARQLSLDRRVALKVLPFAGLLGEKQIARFRNESQASAQLDHPNIVPVYAVGADHGLHFFAMRLIEGRALDDQVEVWKSGPEPTAGEKQRRYRQVARWGAQAADALQAAHEMDVVHRDVKPSNMMVDEKGELWVMDFGLARFRSQSDLTRTGDFLGTMRYMSPEQARGDSRYADHRADVYSLGATLYELLTLRNAIRGDDPAAILRQLERDRPYPLRSFDASIPTDLETIVLKAMASSPVERYDTASEFRDDLNRFLQGHPIQARQPTWGERAWKFLKRRQRLTACIVATFLLAFLMLAVLSAVLLQKDRAASAALRVAEANRRRYEQQLAVNYNQMALTQERNGERAAAVDSWKAALAIHERLAEEVKADLTLPNYANSRQEHANACGNLALALPPEELSEAIAYNQMSRDILESLSKDSASAEVQIELAQQYGNFGSLLRRRGAQQEAMGAFARSVALYQLVANRDGVHLENEIAINLSNLAMAEFAVGETKHSAKRLRSSITLIESQTSPDELTAADQSLLAGLHNNLAMVLHEDRQASLAFESYLRAIDLQSKALTAVPQSARFRSLLSKHYRNYTRALILSKRYDEAAAVVMHRAALWPGSVDELSRAAAELTLIGHRSSSERWVANANDLRRRANDLEIRADGDRDRTSRQPDAAEQDSSPDSKAGA